MAAERKQQALFEQILAKFLINLPTQELQDTNRLAYQVEKAFYYYLDSILGTSNPKDWQQQRNDFLNKLALYSPAVLRIDPRKIVIKIQQNKPVCGALVFNKDGSKILTVRVRNKLGFPKGKWNQNQTSRECAARQVQEETGIYIHGRLDPNIEIEFESHGSSTHFYVARGISEDDRLKIDAKEIDEIFWMRVDDIEPNRWKLAEKSRLAWDGYIALAERKEKNATNLNLYQDFRQKYYNVQRAPVVAQTQNPFLSFRLDRQRLRDALLGGL